MIQETLDRMKVMVDNKEIYRSYNEEPQMKKLLRAMMLINLFDLCSKKVNKHEIS